MTNDYFNHVDNRVSPNTRALDTQINAIADEIAAGFDKISDEQEILANTVNLATNTGSETAMIASLGYTPSLTDGFEIRIRSAFANTGAATLNLNSLGIKGVKNSDGSELSSGAIAADTISTLYYDQPFDVWLLSSNNSIWGKTSAADLSNTSLYCPGYTFTYIDDTSWKVVGFNLVNLFDVARRLKFVDGELTYYGTIVTSVYATGDTTLTMTMEAGDVLTNTIGEVCLISGTAGWSPIATDPFGGSAIRAIATGAISGTQWWVAVGDAGRLFTSTNKGVSWISRASGTVENLKAVSYNSARAVFAIGGIGTDEYAYVAESSNGTTWAEVDVSSTYPKTGGAGDYIHDIKYNKANDYWILSGLDSSIPRHSVTTRISVTWVQNSLVEVGSIGPYILASAKESDSSDTASMLHAIGDGATKQMPDEGGSPLSTIWGFNKTSLFRCYSAEGGHGAKGYGFGGEANGDIDWFSQSPNNPHDEDLAFSDAIRAIAYSILHKRIVCVGDNSTIGYKEADDLDNNNGFVAVQNGFDPLGSILCIDFNEIDGVFIACSDSGQICRSDTGIN